MMNKKIWSTGPLNLTKKTIEHACKAPDLLWKGGERMWRVLQRTPTIALECTKCGWIKIVRLKND